MVQELPGMIEEVLEKISSREMKLALVYYEELEKYVNQGVSGKNAPLKAIQRLEDADMPSEKDFKLLGPKEVEWEIQTVQDENHVLHDAEWEDDGINWDITTDNEKEGGEKNKLKLMLDAEFRADLTNDLLELKMFFEQVSRQGEMIKKRLNIGRDVMNCKQKMELLMRRSFKDCMVKVINYRMFFNFE